MDAALPLDKSSAFFNGLRQQLGEIEKLGQPQRVGGAVVFPAKFEKGVFDMQIVLDDCFWLFCFLSPCPSADIASR